MNFDCYVRNIRNYLQAQVHDFKTGVQPVINEKNVILDTKMEMKTCLGISSNFPIARFIVLGHHHGAGVL